MSLVVESAGDGSTRRVRSPGRDVSDDATEPAFRSDNNIARRSFVSHLRRSPLRAERAQTQRLDLDEARGVFLIVRAAVVLERRDVRVVQRLRALPSDDVDVALVELHADDAVDVIRALVDGLADRLASLGITAFGPSAAAAQLEGSKEFARAFCARHNVPQPAYFPVSDYATACQHIDQLGGFCVIKADGLAAGKGVVVADDAQTAKDAAKSMLDGQFGESGKRLVIGQTLFGEVLSLPWPVML